MKKVLKRKVGSVNVYELTEKELISLEKGLPKILTILSPVLGCFALATSFIRDILNNKLSQQDFILLLVTSSFFIALGFFVLFYNLVIKREKQTLLSQIRKKRSRSNNSIASQKRPK